MANFAVRMVFEGQGTVSLR